jgi:hypothetical protein
LSYWAAELPSLCDPNAIISCFGRSGDRIPEKARSLMRKHNTVNLGGLCLPEW